MKIPHHLQRISVLLLVPLLVLIPVLASQVLAAPPSVTWGPEQVRSQSSNVRNVYPDIGFDANGKMHMAWIEYSSDDASGAPTGPSRVLYTNNVSGSWRAPFEVSASAARHSSRILALQVENNRVHVIYQANTLPITHRYLTIAPDGTPSNSPTTRLSGGTKGYNPHMTYSNGKVHAFWIDNRLNGTQQVFHRIWENGAWNPGDRAVRPSGLLQTFPRSAATADGRIHVVWNENNATARYSYFDGTNWVSSTDLGSGKVRNVALASNGTTLFALYTLAVPVGAADDSHNVYLRRGGNGGPWSNAVLLSSGRGYDEIPEIFYSPANRNFYAVWASAPIDANTQTSVVFREVTSAGSISDLGTIGGRNSSSSDNARGAGGPTTLTVVWQDKATGLASVRQSIATIPGVEPPTPTPTPIPTATPIPPVIFTAVRTSPSPTNNTQIAVTFNNVQGNPTQLRYSLTPFGANDASPAWGAYASGFTINAPASLGATCGVATVYIQLRNSAAQSDVQTVSAVIDTAVQTSGFIRNSNLTGNQLPVNRPATPLNQYGPNAGDDDYTREMFYYYRFSQEGPGCAGIKAYRDQGSLRTVPNNWQHSYFAAVSPAANLNMGPDPGGIGYPEQAFMATVVITDNLNHQTTLQRQMFFDDDPPVLFPGGTLDFAEPTSSTNQEVMTLVLSATVTDDSYNTRTPVGKNYWGAWVLAVDPAVTTSPTPAQFQQYGQAIRLDPGSTTIRGVKLNNGLVTGVGERKVYLAFLDGAGNFSGFTGTNTFDGGLLETATITLQGPLVRPSLYAPIIMK